VLSVKKKTIFYTEKLKKITNKTIRKIYIILIAGLILLGLFCAGRWVHRQIVIAEYNQCHQWLKQSRNFYGYYWTENQKAQCAKVAGFEFNE